MSKQLFSDEQRAHMHDAYAKEFVNAANRHRRHLTIDERKRDACEFLKADSASSDLTIAKKFQLSDKTVATIRKELVAGSEIPNPEKRKDKNGRLQSATKTMEDAEDDDHEYDDQGKRIKKVPYIFEKLGKPADRVFSIPGRMEPRKAKSGKKLHTPKKGDIKSYVHKIAVNEVVALLVDKEKREDVRWDASALYDALYGYEKQDGETAAMIEKEIRNVMWQEVVKAYYAYCGRTKELPAWIT